MRLDRDELTGPASVAARLGAPIEWTLSEGLVPYREAVSAMEARAAAIAAGEASEQVWLLEHPPLYTAGTVPAAMSERTLSGCRKARCVTPSVSVTRGSMWGPMIA